LSLKLFFYIKTYQAGRIYSRHRDARRREKALRFKGVDKLAVRRTLLKVVGFSQKHADQGHKLQLGKPLACRGR